MVMMGVDVGDGKLRRSNVDIQEASWLILVVLRFRGRRGDAAGICGSPLGGMPMPW